MFDDPALDIGVPSETIADIENQVLQSDFCDEETWAEAGKTRCTQKEEIPTEPADSHRVEPSASTPIESNSEATDATPQDLSRTEEEQNESNESNETHLSGKPGGPLRLRHRLRLSRRGRADGGGPVRRCHRLCPHGDGGIWLRPGVPGAGEGQDLRTAEGRGEGRHLP